MTKYYVPIIIGLFIIIGGFAIINSTNKNTPPAVEPPPIEKGPSPEIIPPKVDEDMELLESMTLEEKIGQLLIAGFQEGQPSEKTQSLIKDYHIGGFILFDRNFSDLDSLIQLTNQLKSWNNNKLPLFISMDEEGGRVSRLPKEATKFPNPRILGDIDDLALTFKVASVMGTELNALGINMNFAPVMDVVSTPNNKLLYNRAFGGNPQIASNHGVKFIEGLQDEGVMAVAKHFPGHGDTTVDSHGDLPKIPIGKETLLTRDLIPFKDAILSEVSGIMVGHIAFPQIDDSGLPATKSKIIIDILRKDLGYKGLIITDDIEMLGYAKNEEQLSKGVLESLSAGVDIFIVGHTFDKQIVVVNTIKQAVKDNIISESQIDESVLRVIKAKNKYIIDTIADLDGAKKAVGSKDHKAVLTEVLDRRP